MARPSLTKTPSRDLFVSSRFTLEKSSNCLRYRVPFDYPSALGRRIAHGPRPPEADSGHLPSTHLQLDQKMQNKFSLHSNLFSKDSAVLFNDFSRGDIYFITGDKCLLDAQCFCMRKSKF